MNIRKLAYTALTGSVLLVGTLAVPAAQATAALLRQRLCR
jgi:hypothetical protein